MKEEGKMVLNSRLKWVGLVGLVLSAISLFIHFLLARFTEDGYTEYQSSIIVFSWRPIFGNANFPRTVMRKYLPTKINSFFLLSSFTPLSFCFERSHGIHAFWMWCLTSLIIVHLVFCCWVPEFLLLGCLWEYDFVLVLRNEDISVVFSSWVLSSWILFSALCLFFSMDLFLNLCNNYGVQLVPIWVSSSSCSWNWPSIMRGP
jgi:hypothetical protein